MHLLITIYIATLTRAVLDFFPLKSYFYFIGCKEVLAKREKMWVMVFLKKISNSVITKDVLKWHEYFSSRWVSFRGQVVKRKPSHTLHQHRGMRDQCIYWAMDFQWAYKLIGGWTCPRSNDFKVIAGSVNCADLHCVSLIADLTNEQFRGIQAWTLPCALNGMSAVTVSDILYICPVSSKSLGWASAYSGKKREKQLFSVIEFWRS